MKYWDYKVEGAKMISFKKLLRSALAVQFASLSLVAASFPEPPSGSGVKGKETAVLAGGCFWGTEAVFEQLKGVLDVESGYAGGTKSTANYDLVSEGSTGHAESIKITYDPSQISYGQILKVFFSVAHDPTQLNRQGNDVGPQYRSAIFYSNDEQKKVAETYIQDLDKAKVFRRAIVTKVVPLDAFYKAERYHQDFVKRNPTQPYVVSAELPKLRDLQKQYPEMLKAK
jgi:peptide-methionine (S)-S-oxide reductase